MAERARSRQDWSSLNDIQEYKVAFGRCISSAMVPMDSAPFLRVRNEHFDLNLGAL